MTELRLRETVQLNPYSVTEFFIRYDFAYVDPASGWPIHICVDAIAQSDSPAVLDELVAPVAKAAIARMLKRKCGVKRAVEGQLPLAEPRTVRVRWV